MGDKSYRIEIFFNDATWKGQSHLKFYSFALFVSGNYVIQVCLICESYCDQTGFSSKKWLGQLIIREVSPNIKGDQYE